jgi:hypothetical protein
VDVDPERDGTGDGGHPIEGSRAGDPTPTIRSAVDPAGRRWHSERVLRNPARALAHPGGFSRPFKVATAPTLDLSSGPSTPSALLLRLVARRHVDLHRVNSALCRAVC